jgi:hypothetical protein
LVESFILLEPWWSLRTGSVPYWMTFNAEPSARRLEKYLLDSDPFDEIGLMLFSHGVESIGQTPIGRWQMLRDMARKRGVWLGIDPRAYPRDFGAFFRYQADLIKKIQARCPLPSPLTQDHVESFLAERRGRYELQWLNELGNDINRAAPSRSVLAAAAASS